MVILKLNYTGNIVYTYFVETVGDNAFHTEELPAMCVNTRLQKTITIITLRIYKHNMLTTMLKGKKNSHRGSDDRKPLHSIIFSNLRDDEKPWHNEQISSLQSCLQKSLTINTNNLNTAASPNNVKQDHKKILESRAVPM
jgi:hypothetical protein